VESIECCVKQIQFRALQDAQIRLIAVNAVRTLMAIVMAKRQYEEVPGPLRATLTRSDVVDVGL
jgi:hypothetical protein